MSGSPRLSVVGTAVQEGSGATLDFVVTLSKQREVATTVDYATEDGIAVAGRDYESVSGILTFAAGETSKTVSVGVLDDVHDEGPETVIFRLSNADGAYIEDGTAAGTIHNSDPIPKACLVRFGRTVGSQAVDALAARFKEHRSSRAVLGGLDITRKPGAHLPDVPGSFSEAGNGTALRPMTARSLLGGSAFHFSNFAERTGRPVLTGWGRIASNTFKGESGNVTLDGDVTTGLVGFDAEWDRGLAGIMLSQSSGDGTFQQNPDNGNVQGTIRSSLAAIYPYARINLGTRLFAWGLAGAGSGEFMGNLRNGNPITTDITMRMAATGIKGRIVDGGAHGMTVDIGSDAMWVEMESDRTDDLIATRGNVTRLRLTIDGERSFRINDKAVLVSTGEIGLRHDGGDAEAGTGVEAGTGIRYTAGGVIVEGRVRKLIMHETGDYRNWGAAGAIHIVPNLSGRGLALRISPIWGDSSTTVRRLWNASDLTNFAAVSGSGTGKHLDVEAGYGFVQGGILTPYVGLVLGDAPRRTRAGIQWRETSGATFTLEAAHNGSSENMLTLNMALRP